MTTVTATSEDPRDRRGMQLVESRGLLDALQQVDGPDDALKTRAGDQVHAQLQTHRLEDGTRSEWASAAAFTC